ncbi:MAG: hypothetical protein FWF63_04590 [Fibromonadales bacterium]|nr:hypothetical protein [Fibromonadales bacterium]
MEMLTMETLTQLGIPSGFALGLYLLSGYYTKQRKEERDSQMQVFRHELDTLKESLSKHINRHESYEKGVCGKIDKIYERLNPISDSVNFIKGVLQEKNDKGK